jgi:hypothetical protein
VADIGRSTPVTWTTRICSDAPSRCLHSPRA